MKPTTIPRFHENPLIATKDSKYDTNQTYSCNYMSLQAVHQLSCLSPLLAFPDFLDIKINMNIKVTFGLEDNPQ